MDDDKLASSPKSSRCKLPKQSSSAVLLGRLAVIDSTEDARNSIPCIDV